MLNCALGTLHMANHSSFFCPLTLRGGLGRRPHPPTTFPLINYDVSRFHSLEPVTELQFTKTKSIKKHFLLLKINVN